MTIVNHFFFHFCWTKVRWFDVKHHSSNSYSIIRFKLVESPKNAFNSSFGCKMIFFYCSKFDSFFKQIKFSNPMIDLGSIEITHHLRYHSVDVLCCSNCWRQIKRDKKLFIHQEKSLFLEKLYQYQKHFFQFQNYGQISWNDERKTLQIWFYLRWLASWLMP